MKNIFKLIGIIAIVAVFGLSLASCGPTDGTLEIVNSLGGPILCGYVTNIDDVNGTYIAENGRLVADGNKTSWSLEEGKIAWYWMSIDDSEKFDIAWVTIVAGETVTITAK